MALKERHEAYLERNARRASEQLGRRVSKEEVLWAVLDLAITDEQIYDPAAPFLLSPVKRSVEPAPSTTQMSPDEVVRALARRTNE